ncbi:lysozyme [Orrella dioscoreae]|uniref:Lysozyme n=1 Tax=Orrella dioscoreae TaxID=1851544 RepID=A0A1C3K393_9BURK|nr:lysozyme [Orrella dioscoreae]SBT25979.1 putative phage lysozyme [Orrella dioscoreae]SOE50861.1 putative phage lysozyme [Orrella dioscoreae]
MKLGQKIIGGVLGLITAGALTLNSDELQSHLGRWEGEGQNVVYADKLAGGLPTVCKGITKWTSPDPVIVGDYWSDERCAWVEKMVVEHGQLELAECLNVYITQPIFDALSDFGHHFGNPSVCASRAVGLINAGQVRAGCDALAHAPSGRPVWSYVGTTFYRGLYNRALSRRSMCLRGLQ